MILGGRGLQDFKNREADQGVSRKARNAGRDCAAGARTRFAGAMFVSLLSFEIG